MWARQLRPSARRSRGRGLLARFRRFFGGIPEPHADVLVAELVDVMVGGVYAGIYQRIAAERTVELPELLPTLTFYVLAPFLGRAEAAARTSGASPQVRRKVNTLCAQVP